jgi:hypothetical protein
MVTELREVRPAIRAKIRITESELTLERFFVCWVKDKSQKQQQESNM